MLSYHPLNVARLYLVVLIVKFTVGSSIKSIVYSDQKKEGKCNRRRKKWKMYKEAEVINK